MVFLKNEILKKKLLKKPPKVRVKPGTFGSSAGALPIELHVQENISFMQYLITIKIENMLYGPGKFLH